MSAKDAKKYTIVSLNTNKQSDVYKKMEATATCWRARQISKEVHYQNGRTHASSKLQVVTVE